MRFDLGLPVPTSPSGKRLGQVRLEKVALSPLPNHPLAAQNGPKRRETGSRRPVPGATVAPKWSRVSGPWLRVPGRVRGRRRVIVWDHVRSVSGLFAPSCTPFWATTPLTTLSSVVDTVGHQCRLGGSQLEMMRPPLEEHNPRVCAVSWSKSQSKNQNQFVACTRWLVVCCFLAG